MEPDFSGWASQYNIKCTDGRTIMSEAFQHMDGMEVPLVWSHKHDDPELVLGTVKLTHKAEGLWADAYFNENPKAKASKELVHKKNIRAMSIWANNLVEKAGQVFHGAVKEVSLVLAGANKGATIEFVNVVHSDGEVQTFDDVAVIFSGENIVHTGGDEEVQGTETTTVTETETSTQVESGTAAASKDAAPAGTVSDDAEEEGGDEEDGEIEHGDGPSPEAVQEFYNGLSEDDQEIVMHMVGAAMLAAEAETAAAHSDTTDEGAVLAHQEGSTMTRTIFEGNAVVTTDTGRTLSHDDISSFATKVYSTAQATGFKQAILAHAGEYGITNIEVLFPDAKTIDQRPEWITRKMEWVEGLLNGTKKVPWSKIKSMSADLTHEDARAKGYIKSTLKKEQYFEIASRETGPKTIYKKQKLDRDDIIDMTDFDVVAWLWVEMRFMLREEVARAILIGDGRDVADPDKINESAIRPIAKDHEFYTDKVTVAAGVTGIALVDELAEKREGYEGENPNAYMTRATMNEMLLARTGGEQTRHFRTRADLAAELDVEQIVLVPILKDAKVGTDDLLMIIVNPADYVVGQTRGGEITTFEDFDIDFNQHKYLIETRLSGALVKHKTAQVVVRTPAVTP